MEVEEEGEVEKGVDGNIKALGDTEFLTQEVDPTRTTLVDARNGLKELSRLAVLWNMRHCWPAGERFAFN